MRPSAIRYYERARVIRPGRRLTSGYRDYDEGLLTQLLFVSRAKAVGFSLAEISTLLSAETRARGPRAQELVRRKLRDVALRRVSLQIVEKRLRALLTELERPDSASRDIDQWLQLTREVKMDEGTRATLSGFDTRAFTILDGARQQAQGFGHTWIGVEHLLIALLGEAKGKSADLLRTRGVTAQSVRSDVTRITGNGETRDQSVALTPRVQQVIGIAHGFALRDGRVADPEDLLLGILVAGESIASTVLVDRGVDLSDLRTELLSYARP